MGSQGVASFVWGLLADAVGIAPALTVAAAILLLVALSVVFLPLHPGTGTLDRTIVGLGSGEPRLVFEPDPTDGPVTIAVEYVVRDGEEAAFVAAMSAVERSRRRTGASSWRLSRNGDAPRMYHEVFTVPSWSEFARGNAERWTGYDRQTLETALAHVDAPISERHFFPT